MKDGFEREMVCDNEKVKDGEGKRLLLFGIVFAEF